MAPYVAITLSLINRIMPFQVLTDLLTEPNDTENDLSILLNWLQPYYLHPNTEYTPPLTRVRAAARQCLREPQAQLKFVDLLVNSIASEFQSHFGPFVEHAPLSVVLKLSNSLSTYYYRQLSALNLNENASDLFNRSLKAVFVPYLLTPEIRRDLMDYLSNLKSERISSLRSFSAVGMAPFIQSAVVSVTTDRIHQHVTKTCKRVWNQPRLAKLQQWIRLKVYPNFVAGVFDSAKAPGSSICNDLVIFAQDELVLLRTNEIYEMVVNCSASEIALTELHQCLASGNPTTRTSQRARLVDTFISHCNLDLLHLGSNTVKIIVEYINTIKAFLFVDPTGVLLDKVARPIRKYLKTRRDLVPHLVKGMLDADPRTNRLYELAHALRHTASPASAAIDDLTDIDWIPDPIDALPDFKKGKVSDFVDALTSVLPLPVILVDEFTKLFGARLLDKDGRREEIVSDVEKLKGRFGANEFATLDVMIRDVEESAALNIKIGNLQLEMTVLSRNYWPGISSQGENDMITLPILDKMGEYGKLFSKLKNGRYLSFLPSMGLVVVELVFDNACKEYTVSPAQAAVIEIFNEDEEEISLKTVTLSTGISNYVATQAIDFWVKLGVLENVAPQRYKAVCSISQ